jgi:hypothetical protein
MLISFSEAFHCSDPVGKCNLLFILTLTLDSSASEIDDDPEEAPVRLRRRRLPKRKDRAVHDLTSALDSTNYDPIPPPAAHIG